jgi:hypothetical protein
MLFRRVANKGSKQKKNIIKRMTFPPTAIYNIFLGMKNPLIRVKSTNWGRALPFVWATSMEFY